MRILGNLCRILTGLVFMFSGFVKGVDPLGTAYRIEDYLQVFHMTWLMPSALVLSIILCTFEFVLGVSLVFSIRLKFTAWVLLFVSGFFTILTFFDALNNTVPDCGCFGDALKLSNWATFYKNIALMILTVIIFYRRKRTVPCFLPKIEVMFIGIVTALFALFSVYSYTMLPVIDFLPFKTGSHLINPIPPTPKIYLTYKNKKTGETKEYLSPNFPWKDKVWMEQWEFVSQRVNKLSDNDMIYIQDQHSLDITREVLSNKNGELLIVCYDWTKANQRALVKVIEFGNQAVRQYLSTVMLTSSAINNHNFIAAPTEMHFEFYNADDVQLKMLVRANPGVVLVKDGVIMGKWSAYNLPTVNDLYKILLKQPEKKK